MKFSDKNKQILYFELEKFIRSGFGFDKACEAILDQPGTPQSHRIFCSSVLNGLKNKKTIGQAIADLPLNISPLEINMVTAGEEAGMLGQSFAHLAKHFKLAAETRRKIRKSLLYPVILLHAGAILGIVVISMLTAWNPQAQAGDGWRSLTAGLALFFGLYFVVISISIFFSIWIRRAKSSPPADRLLSRLPLLGLTRRNLAMSRFCEVFHMALCSGKKIDQCLHSAGLSAESGCIGSASEGGATIVAKGTSLAAVLSANPEAFPPDFCRSIANAELAGVLDEDLGQWADFYRNAAVEAVERLAEWLPRLFHWGVLLIVAVVIIRMALAYRGLLEGYLNT